MYFWIFIFGVKWVFNNVFCGMVCFFVFLIILEVFMYEYCLRVLIIIYEWYFVGLFGKVKLVYSWKIKEYYVFKCVSKVKVIFFEGVMVCGVFLNCLICNDYRIEII